MAGRRLRHRFTVGVPQPGAALDIGEQQRHRARGEPHLPIVRPIRAASPTSSAFCAICTIALIRPSAVVTPTSDVDPATDAAGALLRRAGAGAGLSQTELAARAG